MTTDQNTSGPTYFPRNWREHAACRGADTELFFPVGTSGPALVALAEAKAICRSCPVTRQCLAWALEHAADDGVWGGLDPAQRRALRGRGLPAAPMRTAG